MLSRFDLNRSQNNSYASVVAIESTSKLDDEQWLAYWIIYSFLTLMEMVLQPVLEWSVLVRDDFPLFFFFFFSVTRFTEVERSDGVFGRYLNI